MVMGAGVYASIYWTGRYWWIGTLARCTLTGQVPFDGGHDTAKFVQPRPQENKPCPGRKTRAYEKQIEAQLRAG